jgi:hypothetical protein
MELIVQHNFNTGFGDGLFAMTDYLNNVYNLKKLGYRTKLKFNLNGNLYFKSHTPLDYLDRKIFEIFDEISFNENIFYETNHDGFTCVFTHAHANPGQHYWDLFVDNDSLNFYYENHIIENYNMINMISGKKPKIIPLLSSEILDNFNQFVLNNNITEYKSIYFRTQDLDEELDFLESKKEELIEILNKNQKIFICSNSKEFKNFVKNLNLNNVYYWELPLENEWGGNHLLHQRIDDENLHQRTIYTLLDMWTLCSGKEIYFFTTWGRYSNFMVYAPINNCKIHYK